MESFLVWILESSLLVLLILGIRKIFMGKIRYATIYALWLLILVRFLIPVNFISTPFSIGNLVSETVSRMEEKNTGQTENTAEMVGKDQYPEIQTSEPAYAGSVQSTPAEPQQTTWTEPENKKETFPAEEKEEPVWNISDRTKNVMQSIWLLVSGILFLWLIMSNVSLNRKLKRNRVAYGRREGVHIYLVSGIKNPCLYGFFRPAIYLPAAFIPGPHGEGQSREEVGQMIMHEYVHYRHGDHIWAMFRILLVSLYWFDPFLWLAVFCSKKDAELACDETVIGRLGEKKRFLYGEMLVRLAADTSWADFRYSLTAMSRKGKEMEKRIRAISVCKQYSRWVLVPLVTAVLLTVGFTCSTGIGPQTGEQQERKQDSETTKEAEPMMAGNLRFGTDGFYSNLSFGAEGRETDSYEDVFYRYVRCFTDAVNTGNVDAMKQVLAEGSEVYEQQCRMAENYFKRGIREEVKACSISSVKRQGSRLVVLESAETIKATYEDASSRIIDQTYVYTCEKGDQGWRITRMDEKTVFDL